MISVALMMWMALAAGPSPLDPARTARQQADQALARLDAEVHRQQAQLDAIARQIAGLKAQQQARPALFVPGKLEALLRQSQSLSDALGRLQADEGRARQDDEAARAQLRTLLDGQIAQERQGAADVDPAGKARRLEALRSLEVERAALLPSLPATGPAPVFAAPSDDPRELRERADALRDRTDKLAQAIAALDSRAQEVREERELERQMHSLSADESLFDESDSTVHLSRSEPASAPAAAQPGAGPSLPASTLASSGQTSATKLASAATAPSGRNADSTTAAGVPQGGGSFGTPTAQASATAAPSAHVDPLPAPGASATPLGETREGTLVNPQDLAGAGTSAPDEADDSLEALAVRRAELVREQQRLAAQVRALDDAARAAEGFKAP